MHPADFIRVRTDDVSRPRSLAKWLFGRVSYTDKLSGNIGVHWFDCKGPMGTIEDQVTSETLFSLKRMQCELVSNFSYPDGWNGHAV